MYEDELLLENIWYILVTKVPFVRESMLHS